VNYENHSGKRLEANEINECARVGRRVCADHEAYLELWDLIEKEDAEIGIMFNDLRRSTALIKLAQWHSHGLLSESDLALFTEETRNTVKAINEFAL
jgi:hypothetical protein